MRMFAFTFLFSPYTHFQVIWISFVSLYASFSLYFRNGVLHRLVNHVSTA